VQRRIEVESRLKRVMAVVKVRDSAHSSEIRQFEITEDGIQMGERMDYEGMAGGRPTCASTMPASVKRPFACAKLVDKRRPGCEAVSTLD
jgi:hypothetical protein